MAIAADTLSTQATGVYFTLNPVEPELLRLYRNRVERRPRKTSTDTDILHRTRILVDIDPQRYSLTTGRPCPGDLSATDAEKAGRTRPPSESEPTSPPPAGPNQSPSTAATASICCTG